MLNDRLFINEKEVDLSPDTVIALTLQINDLAELKDRQSNLSNQFKLPKSRRNRMILENADMAQSPTRKPYRKLPARIIKDGIEVVTDGYAIIESSDQFYNVTVYSGNVNFFDLIDGKMLSDIDFSAYEHLFDLTNVVASRANLSGYKYPIIDYGLLSNANRDVDVRNLRPAFFQPTLIDEIFSQAGYNKAGNIFSNSQSNKIIIPFSKNDFNFFPDQLHTGATTINPTSFGFMTPNLTLDTDPPDVWNIEILLTIKVNSFVFGDPLDTDNFLFVGAALNGGGGPASIAAFSHETISIPGGATPIPNFTGESIITLGVDSIGNQTAVPAGLYKFKITASGFNTPFPSTPLVIIFAVNSVSAYPGSSIDAEIQNATFYAENTAGTKKFKVMLDDYALTSSAGNQQVSFVGGVRPFIYFDQTLPEISQKELLQNWANTFALFFKSDPLTKTILIKQFDEIVEAIPLAKDWTDKLHMDEKKWKTEYRSNYGQTNWLKYKEDTSDLNTRLFGDGNFLVDDETLRAEKDIYNSPFAPSVTKKLLEDLDIAVIKKIDAGVFSIQTEPRILIDDTQDISGADIHYNDGTSSSDENTDIPLCYFKLPAKSFNLGFDNSLIADNYQGLTACLDKFKKVTLPFKLTATDIEEVDHFIPVYLKQCGLYFYINKVISWVKSTATVKVELILLQRDDEDAVQFAGFLRRMELEEDSSDSLEEDGTGSLLEDN